MINRRPSLPKEVSFVTDKDKGIANMCPVLPPGEIEGAESGRHTGIPVRYWVRKLAKKMLKHDRQTRCSEGIWAGVFMVDRMLCTKLQRYFRLTGEIVKWGAATDEVGDVGKARWNSGIQKL